jgi:predicted carbohydrate-binding protein with CBM5 and CBM33 domain
MSADEFTKLFKYIQTIDNKIDALIENTSTKDDIQKVLTILDSLTKRQEINDDERLVMGHQLDRLDRWTHELADKIGHTLAT